MRTGLLRIILLVVSAALVTVPFVSSLLAEPAAVPRPSAISDYQADYLVLAGGRLVAKETVAANVRDGRRGIVRTWDVTDPADSRVRLRPENIRAQVDGVDVPVELGWREGRRHRVATIGDPRSSAAAGAHVYAITYEIDGVLAPAPSAADRAPASSVLDWDMVADGWQTGIEKATVRIRLPSESRAVQCTVRRSTAPCDVAGSGTDAVTVATGPVPSRTPVSVRIGLPVETPDRVTAPWLAEADGLLGTSAWALMAVLLVTAATGVLGHALERRSGRGLLPRFLVTAAAAAMLAMGVLWHPPVSMYLLPLAGLVIGGAGLLVPRGRGRTVSDSGPDGASPGEGLQVGRGGRP
jgi:hypothetical protein